MERRGFSVQVDCGSVENGNWLIHAVVAYRPHPAAGAWGDVEGDARRAVMLAIAEETEAARRRGARSVYAVVEGDDEVAGFFRVSGPYAPRERRSYRSAASVSLSS